MTLTDLDVRRFKPAEKPYKLADGGRLFLWVTPSGGKIWRWAFAFEGKEKLKTLGKYPDISLSQARERHGDARKLLAIGKDPMAERKADKTAEQIAKTNSFASVSWEWLEHWQDGKSPPRRFDSPPIGREYSSSLSELQTDEIEAPDVVAMVRAIETRGARDIAKRALETTGQIFRYDRRRCKIGPTF